MSFTMRKTLFMFPDKSLCTVKYRFISTPTVIMSSTLKRNAAFLRLLHKSSPKTRQKLLRNNCSNDLVRCLCECASNVIKGHVPLTTSQLKTLNRKKRMLRALVKKKVSLVEKRKLIQSGGFLGGLLAPIISILGGLLGGGQ